MSYIHDMLRTDKLILVASVVISYLWGYLLGRLHSEPESEDGKK